MPRTPRREPARSPRTGWTVRGLAVRGLVGIEDGRGSGTSMSDGARPGPVCRLVLRLRCSGVKLRCSFL